MRWHGSLRRTGEIAYVRRAGRRSAEPTLAAHVVVGRLPGRWYVAITVSKAVGNAVTRNRVKRRIKGALDTIAPPVLGARAVIVVRAGAGDAAYDVLRRDVAAVLNRSR